MVGIELNCALVVRQISVELAYGHHAFLPILREGLGSRGQSVADDPLIQLLTCLNIKNINVNAVFCKKLYLFLQKSGKKQIKISREKII